MNIENIQTARAAILEDLKRRFKEGDKTVRPARADDLHRWYRDDQTNYFIGAGEAECPICKGRLRYSRAAYNGHVHGTCSKDARGHHCGFEGLGLKHPKGGDTKEWPADLKNARRFPKV